MVRKLTNIICAVLVVYFIFCFGEILVKNTQPNPHYSSFNIITSIGN